MTKCQFGSAAMVTLKPCSAMAELYELTIARQADNHSQVQYYLTADEIIELSVNLSNAIASRNKGQ